MKKIFYFLFLVIALSNGCSKEDSFLTSRQTNVLNSPKHIDEFGKSIATEIRETINNLNKMGVDYSDANYSKSFRDRFYSDWIQANTSKAKSNLTISDIQVDPIPFFERAANATEMQMKFAKRIVDECAKSSSIRNLKRTLINLNEEIYAQVSPIEQERLLYITTTIYYLMTEIDNLEKKGQMLITPRTKFQMAASMKTRSETGEIGGFWESCREVYECACTYVLGATLSTGEVVTAIRLAAIGLFGIMLCLTGDTVNYKRECAEKFTDCQENGGRWTRPNAGYSVCARCHEYCIGSRGIWDCPRPS